MVPVGIKDYGVMNKKQLVLKLHWSWDNLIDEDLHIAWFANKLKELEAIN